MLYYLLNGKLTHYLFAITFRDRNRRHARICKIHHHITLLTTNHTHFLDIDDIRPMATHQSLIQEPPLNVLERVADHCSNIAGCVTEMSAGNLNLHQTIRAMKEDREEFANRYDSYRMKYSLQVLAKT